MTIVTTYPKPFAIATTSCTDMYRHSRKSPILYYTITRDIIPEPVADKKEKPYFRKFEKQNRR